MIITFDLEGSECTEKCCRECLFKGFVFIEFIIGVYLKKYHKCNTLRGTLSGFLTYRCQLRKER